MSKLAGDSRYICSSIKSGLWNFIFELANNIWWHVWINPTQDIRMLSREQIQHKLCMWNIAWIYMYSYPSTQCFIFNACMEHYLTTWGPHSQTTPWAPSHPIQHPRGWLTTPSTPLSCGMASCWQINSIWANSGRKSSIQILNQYPYLWEISILAYLIGLIKFLSF